MPGVMTILRANGNKQQFVIDSAPSLETLQDAVGGYIEYIPMFDRYEDKPCIAYCNEEGKLQDFVVNAAATAIWRKSIGTADVLVGDIVILTGDKDFMEEL